MRRKSKESRGGSTGIQDEPSAENNQLPIMAKSLDTMNVGSAADLEVQKNVCFNQKYSDNVLLVASMILFCYFKESMFAEHAIQ